MAEGTSEATTRLLRHCRAAVLVLVLSEQREKATSELVSDGCCHAMLRNRCPSQLESRVERGVMTVMTWLWWKTGEAMPSLPHRVMGTSRFPQIQRNLTGPI